jgi:hypothetical protein
MMSSLVAIGLQTIFPRIAVADEAGRPPNPHPREIVVGELLWEWDFSTGRQGWSARNHCSVDANHGLLEIHASGVDPYLAAATQVAESRLVVSLRMRSSTSGPGQLFWASDRHPGTSAERNVTFRMQHDGQWHEYLVGMPIEGTLTTLRLDPGTAAGEIEVDWIRVYRGGPHPLEIAEVRQSDEAIQAIVRNHGPESVIAELNGMEFRVGGEDESLLDLPSPADKTLAAVTLQLNSASLPPLERKLWVFQPDRMPASVTLPAGSLTVQAARDGSVVKIAREGETVAAFAPLIHRDYHLPELELVRETWPLRFEGPGITIRLEPASPETLSIQIRSTSPVEGPVLRSFGQLEQGLLAGVEYLGRREVSSSRLDIETAEHLRFEPDPMQLTMPLMATITDRASVAITWEDCSLQPVFAAPDFLDGTNGQRMALKGQQIAAEVRVSAGWNDGGRLESPIVWAVRRRGLPPLPETPRSYANQMQLSLAAYRGMVHDTEHGGWFHAVVPGVRQSPARGDFLADCAASIWRITGQVPEVPRLVPGGAHVRNHAAYFVTGRVDEWLAWSSRRASQLIRGQQADGSFRYDGKYRRGHFENTASGVCARPAHDLLEHAWYTGDAESLNAGLKALRFLQRFRTPRGAQTWEVPLHTPDILASAYATWANVLAFRLTGDPQYLAEARRWAITGLPFVYQWSNQPIMAYATTPVLGATNWVAPNWIGLPVQWCGTVYAYALLDLAAFDDTLPWARIAEGILVCGEQMQYPDGPSAGCLPDVFNLKSQSRHPADINPGALVSLRLRLAGRLDNLDVAAADGHRVAAPFPIRLEGTVAQIDAATDQAYQVLVDGRRIVGLGGEKGNSIDLHENHE